MRTFLCFTLSALLAACSAAEPMGSASGGGSDGGSDGPSTCSIGGLRYAAGTPNPGADCQLCAPAQNAAGWTNTAEGTSCATAGGNVCREGACVLVCAVNGALFDAGDPAPGNPCQICEPTVLASGFSNAIDLTPCASDAGNVCDQGLCRAGCAFGGAFVAAGTLAPGSACQVCTPASSERGYSNVADLTACGADGGEFCVSGSCVSGCNIAGSYVAAGAAAPGNPCEVCTPDSGTAGFTSAANLTACGTDGGSFCMMGTCAAGCSVGGAFFAAGEHAPLNDCRACLPQVNPNALSALPDLSACATNGGNLCSGGACESGCAIGSAFVPQWTYRSPLQSSCCNPAMSSSAWTPAFSAPTAVQTYVGIPNALAIADYNLDRLDDIGLAGSGGASILSGSADAGFSLAWRKSLNGYANAAVSGDFNADGLPDIAVETEDIGIGTTVTPFFNQTDGGFSSQPPLALPAHSIPTGLTAGPYPGLFGDSIAASARISGTTTTALSLFLSNGGAFGGPDSVPIDPGAVGIVSGTLPGSQGEDFAVLCGTSMDLLVSEASGNVPSTTVSNAIAVRGVAMASGQLVTSIYTAMVVVAPAAGSGGTLATYFGAALGTLTDGPQLSITPTPTAVATFRNANSANTSDSIAVADTLGNASIYIMLDGGLVFSATYPAGATSSAIASGDFNGDQLRDLVVADPSGSNVYVLYGQCQ